MPAHRRMRAYDRDLIRGGHYGQRPRVPHLKAEHMAAPTKPASVKKALANSEPSHMAQSGPRLVHRTRVLLAQSGHQRPSVSLWLSAWCPKGQFISRRVGVKIGGIGEHGG